MKSDSEARKLIPKKFLTPGELAVMFGISKTSVYRLADQRAIPFFKIGGSLRFAAHDVEEYLQRVRIGTIGA